MMSEFTINIENCINDKSQPMVIRQLFVDLRKYGYISTGDFFKEMHDGDLDILRNMSSLIEENDETDPEFHRAVESVMMLGVGLCFGEGMVLNEEQATTAIAATTTFIALEYLARSNLITVIRENWSMDPTINKEIARLKGK
jgi:hypothetical protein